MNKQEILELLNKANWETLMDVPNNVEYYSGNNWCPTMNPVPSLIRDMSEGIQYRIKPISKYVPFTANDWKLFMGKMIIEKGSDIKCTITRFDGYGIYTFHDIDYDTAMSLCEFFDVPEKTFGKLVEEEDD